MRSPTTGEVPPAHYGFWTALTERSASVTRLWKDPRRGAASARGPFSFRLAGRVPSSERVRTAQVATAQSPVRLPARGCSPPGSILELTPAGLPQGERSATGLASPVSSPQWPTASRLSRLFPARASGVLLAGSQTQMLFHWP